MQEEIHKRLHAPELGPCACSQVRRLARNVSRLYDTLLSPEDLTITQYSLLANIERAGQVGHAVLAEKVGMERTTLTRNLRPLTRAKWVITGTGKDRRQHLLQLTAAGRRKLVRSLSLWEEAQRQFLFSDRYRILAGTQNAHSWRPTRLLAPAFASVAAPQIEGTDFYRSPNFWYIVAQGP